MYVRRSVRRRHGSHVFLPPDFGDIDVCGLRVAVHGLPSFRESLYAADPMPFHSQVIFTQTSWASSLSPGRYVFASALLPRNLTCTLGRDWVGYERVSALFAANNLHTGHSAERRSRYQIRVYVLCARID